ALAKWRQFVLEVAEQDEAQRRGRTGRRPWRSQPRQDPEPRLAVPEVERDPANALLRRGIREVPRHHLLEHAGDFIERFEGDMKPKVVGSVRARLDLCRVQEREERRLP